tara:strand:+ start:102 stop:323 length:222 start_codon:yes stop_codon:yes gene_type:complete
MTNNLLLNAAIAHYKAQQAEAVASIMLYMNNSVGVGDHSDHLKEIIKWTEKLTEADDCLATLTRYFLSKDENG